MDNFISVKIKSDIINVKKIRNIAAIFVVDSDPNIHIINEIKTILSEAVTNAIIHGYDNDLSRYVTVNLMQEDNILTMEIIDNGKGIENLELALKPMYTTKDDDERSGLGFTIMQVFSDDFKIISDSCGTKITITKNLA